MSGRAKEIFWEAILLPETDQRDFILHACGNDAKLLQRVEALLEEHEDHGPTLKDGVKQNAGEYRRGDKLDQYTILQQIGSGGMGAVYQAQQTAPIKRKVAIKVIRPGIDTVNTLARFQAERQAMAIMDHPSIAKVFHAGSTETGRPWFAMEYIQGEELMAFCDENKLDTRQRLKLFIQICEAIQHAHLKGIMHRDLKPGNILVTRDKDDQPLPKIIDFGIAKAIHTPLTEMTLHTHQGNAIGTLPYMSPEQVRGSSDIDMRTDVYSLGVILYELISGHVPFAMERGQDTSNDSLKETIRKKAPQKPSTKLTSADHDKAQLIAQARGTDTSTLAAMLRKELELIPLMALQKERHKRYESPKAMAEDVQRYLNDEALVAHPETKTYRTLKFISRNRTGVAISAAFVALLVLATIISISFMIQANSLKAEAEAKTLEAKEQTRIADEATAGLSEFALKLSDAYSTISEREKQVEEQANSLEEQANSLAEQGNSLEKIREDFSTSVILGNQIAEENENFRNQVLQIINCDPRYYSNLWQEFLRTDTDDADVGDESEELMLELKLFRIFHLLARSNKDTTSLSDTEWSRKLESIQKKAAALNANDAEMIHRLISQFQIVDCLEIARASLRSEEMPLALKMLQQCDEISKANFRGDTVIIKSDIYHAWGNYYFRNGNLTEAASYYRQAQSIRQLLKNQSGVRWKLWATQNNLANVYLREEQFEEAEQLLRDVLAEKIFMFGDEHEDVAFSMNGLALALQRQGKLKDAEKYFLNTLAIKEKLLGETDHSTLMTRTNLGSLYTEQGKFELAEKNLMTAYEGKKVVLGKLDSSTLNSLRQLSSLYTAWHQAEPDAGHDIEAAKYRRMLEEIQKNSNAEPATP